MRRPARTRTCCGCMNRLDQSELVRVVRDSSGNVRVDTQGGAPGRGAYVCRSMACVEAARKKKRLSRVLRGEVPDAVYDAVIAFIEQTGGNDHR